MTQFKEEFEKNFGKSFCLAKWKHLTLYLQLGEGHSCYHPPPTSIEKTDLIKTPEALHNTELKLNEREQMLSGTRPTGCSYCWKTEDANQQNFSDRIIKSYEQSKGSIEIAKTVFLEGASLKTLPTYVEISFSNKCNFKCVYCNPKASSLWEDEIKRNGPYKDIENDFSLKQEILPEENTYSEAFLNWWPTLSQNLEGIRITGGEPLLHETTKKIFEDLKLNPKTHLTLMINSNLGVPESKVTWLIDECNKLKNKCKNIRIYTSLETTGSRAEYARFGLNYAHWLKNVERVLTETDLNISLMCTYNIYAVTGFTDFLKLIQSLRNKYSTDGQRIKIDISYLEYPRMFFVGILPEKYLKYLIESQNYIKNNLSSTDCKKFSREELHMLEKIESVWRANLLSHNESIKLRKDLKSFIQQSDARRKTNFVKSFPEMIELLEGNNEY